MSSETPILELKIRLTITLDKRAQLEKEKTTVEIERAEVEQQGWKYDKQFKFYYKEKNGFPSYIKYLLHDFISQTTYKKSCCISYIYMNINKNIDNTSYDTSYICYDAISVKHEQDVRETIAPASFIEVDKISPFSEVEKIFDKIIEEQEPGPLFRIFHGKSEETKKTEEARKFVYKFLSKSAHVKINAKFIKIHNEKNEYNFIIDQEIKFFRYPWGEHLLVLPVPKLPEPGKPPKHGQLLGIRSYNDQPDAIWSDVWESLEKLNTILRTPGKKKIFIKGAPGSGKEVFANAIHYGSVRSKPDKLVARSVAGADTQELRKLLFGREIEGVNIAGLIEKADGGTLFLDEFDKIEEEKFYSELLRVLEAGEYIPVKGKKTRKVGDVNWIFAGAFMGTDSSKATTDLPQDFWSRLTSLINIKNPITFDRENDYYSYAGVMFLYFFIQEVVKTGGGVERITSASKKGDFRSHIARLFIDIDQELLKIDAHLIDEIMEKFQDKKFQDKKYGRRYAGINCGQYFWSGKEKKDDSQNNRCQEEENTCWSYIDNKTIVPCKGYDSVRSIRQAAKVAFARCFNAALGLQKPSKKTFWPNKENKNAKDEIYKAIKEAAETVFITRPGKQI